MTEKDLIKALQNVDECLIIEADEVAPAKKSVKYHISEKVLDNIVTAALALLVVGMVALIPVLKNNNTQSDPGYDYNYSTNNPSRLPLKLSDLLDKDTDEISVVDEVLYEYDKEEDSYIVSSTSCNGISLSLNIGGSSYKFERFNMRTDLKWTVEHNAVITPDNAKRIYYLVAFRTYNNKGDGDWTEMSQEEACERLKDLGYNVFMLKEGSYRTAYSNDVIIYNDCICGVLTYEQMTELPASMGNYCASYELLTRGKY